MRSLTHGTERCGHGARRVTALVTLLVALVALPGTASGAEGDFLLKQCVNNAGANGCDDGNLMSSAWDVTPSPDGRHAYVSTFGNDTLLIFDRDPQTGRLSQRPGAEGCYKHDTPANATACTPVRAMDNPLGVIVSPDGAHVYVAAWGSSGITVFDRNADTGRLTQKPLTEGCIGATAGCKPGRALANVLNLFFSPNGKNIYATAQTGGGAIAILNVDDNGQLSQEQNIDGCVTESGNDGAGNACADGTAISLGYQLTVSPDGKHVYGASGYGPNAITLFIRDEVTGGLTQRNGTAGCISQNGFPDGVPTNRCGVQAQIANPYGVRITPDGRFVYLLGNNGTNGSIVVFERSANGLLTFRSCVNEDGSSGCSDGRGVSSIQAGAISPDGKALVAKNQSGGGTGGMSFFNINSGDGSLTQRPGVDGCATNDGSVPNGAGGTIAGQCRVVPTLGGEGNVQFVGDTILNYGGFSQGAAVVFDRDFAPVCTNRSSAIAHNTSTQLQLSCSDRNNDAVTYAITRAPAAGLTGNPDNATARVFYGPFTGFTGADSFDYQGTARGVASNVARYDLAVAGPPAPPPPPPPGGPTLIPSTVGNNWAAARTFTTVISLSAKRLPAGASVVVKCKTKSKRLQKKRCPYKSKSFKAPARKNQVNLAKLFRKKKLPVGTKITVTITAPGFIGKKFVYTTRRRAIPKLKLTCLTPGSSTKSVSCPG